METPQNQPDIDLISLLQLGDFDKQKQELGMREFRIRGIDQIIAELKKQLNKEEVNALNRYLRMCPQIDQLVLHIQNDYPESQELFEAYIPKLHKKIPSLK